MEDLEEEIKKEIAKGLPGLKAQQKLAPESRNLFPDGKDICNAAVLILIYKNKANNINSVLMKRPAYNGPHSNQISFPGGKEEESDNSLKETAVRECYEEIGISPEKINTIGKLSDLYIPVSNFLVHPYIGILNSKPEFVIDKNEVDYLIEFELCYLVNSAISVTSKEYRGNSYKVPYFNINNEIIWGATAMIMSEFIEIIKKPSIYKKLNCSKEL